MGSYLTWALGPARMLVAVVSTGSTNGSRSTYRGFSLVPERRGEGGRGKRGGGEGARLHTTGL